MEPLSSAVSGNSVLEIDTALTTSATFLLSDFILTSGAGSLTLNGLDYYRRLTGVHSRSRIGTAGALVGASGTIHIVSDAFNSSLTQSSTLTVNGSLLFDPNTTLNLTSSAAAVTLNTSVALNGSITGSGSVHIPTGVTVTTNNQGGSGPFSNLLDGAPAERRRDRGRCWNTATGKYDQLRDRQRHRDGGAHRGRHRHWAEYVQ